MVLFGACIRLAVGLLVLLGVGAGASLAFPRANVAAASSTPMCELGILFESEIDHERGLYWIHPDGSGLMQVVNYADTIPAWINYGRASIALSPDGRWLAIGYRSPIAPGYYFGMIDLFTGATGPLLPDANRNRQFFWSPDGTQIAYIAPFGDDQVHILDVATLESRLLVDANDPEIARHVAFGRFASIDWSDDGEQIVLDFFREGNVTAASNISLVVNVETGAARRIIPHTAAFPFGRSWAAAWGTADGNVVYYGCTTTRQFDRAGLCAVDQSRSLSVQVLNTAMIGAGGYRVTRLDAAPAPDSRLLFSINDASDQMYVFDTRTGDLLNLSAVSGARGEMPRWFCRPNIS